MNALCVSNFTSRRDCSDYSFGFLAAAFYAWVDGLGRRGLRSLEMRETKGDSAA
jgi:hypothetical protein